MANSFFPKILLWADCNSFSLEVYKTLQKYKLEVDIVSRDTLLWRKNLGNNLADPQIYNEENEISYDKNINYVLGIFEHSFLEKIDDRAFERDLKKLRIFETCNDCKKIFVFSYNQNSEVYLKTKEAVEKIIEEGKESTGIVFIGDLFENNKKEKYYFESQVISGIEKGYFNVSKGFQFFPISSREAADLLVQSLFSLKAYGAKSAIIGKAITCLRLNLYLSRYFPGLREYKGDFKQTLPEVKEKKYSQERIKKLLEKAFYEISKKIQPVKGNNISLIFKSIIKEFNKRKNKPDFEVYLRVKNKNRSTYPKKSKVTRLSQYSIFKSGTGFSGRFKMGLYFIVFVLFIIPFSLFIISMINIISISKLFNAGYFKTIQGQLKFSLVLSKAGEKYFHLLSHTPYIGKHYKYFEHGEEIIYSYTGISERVFNVFDDFIEYSETLSLGEEFEDYEHKTNLSLELKEIYKEISFLEGKVKDGNWFTVKISDLIFKKEDFKRIKNKTIGISKIIENEGWILGKDKPRTYLILFQNDTLIRATGGIIESFATLKVTDGKIIEKRFYNVSDADKRLEGKVEPPTAIKKYFQTDTWYLRDSNWDPDFSVSASQAEWFIDKELDISVDGIISINSKLMKKIVEEIGLQEFSGKNLSFLEDREDLLFEKKNLYPNDYKESGQRELFEYLFDKDFRMSRKEKALIIKLLIEGLEIKDIQIFFKNNNLRDIIQNIGWDGTLVNDDCLGNCYSDTIATVESAIEGNSLKLKRLADLKVYMEENLVKRKLTFFYENYNDFSYKTYLRVYANSDSGFSPAKIVDENDTNFFDLEIKGQRGFKEAGIYIEIPGKQTKAVVFSWESGSKHSYEEDGEYKLYLWKQSGINEFPVEIEVQFPKDAFLEIEPPESLTGNNSFSYNTLLSQGFPLSFFWKKYE